MITRMNKTSYKRVLKRRLIHICLLFFFQFPQITKKKKKCKNITTLRSQLNYEYNTFKKRSLGNVYEKKFFSKFENNRLFRLK